MKIREREEKMGADVKIDSPVLMAPVGVQQIFHEDKEIGLSQVCAEIGVPFVLSTASSSSIEEVAAASTGPKWFQLYWPQSNSITISLLNRAKAANYKVLVVTLDTWALAWRPADLDHAFIPFIKGVGNKNGFTDPVFRKRFEGKYGAGPEEMVMEASQEWIGDVFSGAAHGWEDIKLLRENWEGPIVLKGIQVCGNALRLVFCLLSLDFGSTRRMRSWQLRLDVMELLFLTMEVTPLSPHKNNRSNPSRPTT
jgi:lactate 2-monooxygenase